jgi:hypothetical protein
MCNIFCNKCPKCQVNTDRLSGINLAQYVLNRLAQNGDTVQTLRTLSRDFDGNEAFVLSLISFLEDVGWMKEA